MIRLVLLPVILAAFSGCAGQSSTKRDAPATPKAPASTPARTPAVPPLVGPLVHEFTGDWFLKGTMTKEKPGNPEWLMSAAMEFPTGGYTVGELIVRQTRSYPETVWVTIPVTPPPKDALVTQAITPFRIEKLIPGTDRATFQVTVETAERK